MTFLDYTIYQNGGRTRTIAKTTAYFLGSFFGYFLFFMKFCKEQ